MSADNFFLVLEIEEDKFEVYHRFASFDWYESDEVIWETLEDSIPCATFHTEKAAEEYVEADENWTEYGPEFWDHEKVKELQNARI